MMPLLLELCTRLYDSPVGVYIRESDNLFSVIETVHVLGIGLAVGTIALVDLRLLGWVLVVVPVRAVVSPLVRLAWVGFAVMLSSGALLFWAEAAKLYFNAAFRLKLLLLGLAGVNAALFHATAYRHAGEWEAQSAAPLSARIAAACSLLLWSAIVVSGRAIAYA